MTEDKLNTLIAENTRRNSRLKKYVNPATGEGCSGVRVMIRNGGTPLWVPASMAKLNPSQRWDMPCDRFERLRCHHDFDFWAWRCVKIRDKESGALVPFVLNNAQRRIVTALEEDRLAHRPLRVILLKARQCGGSTLIQMYMAWIQCVLRTGWNSLICAQVKGTSNVIRQMYATMLANYPQELWEGDDKSIPRLKGRGEDRSTRVIDGRDCEITVSSSMTQDSTRGINCAMAHLSEVAYWKDSEKMSPEAFMKTVSGGIGRGEMTLIALESTANGSGNLFHREWLRARAGKNGMRGIFVAWHEVERYRQRVSDVKQLWESLDEYERGLWERGLTMEMIAWYHSKRREMGNDDAMKAEYPTDEQEAFVFSDCNVFDPMAVSRLRAGCHEPLAIGEVTGRSIVGPDALEDVRFSPGADGGLKVWKMPEPGHEYVTAVDVGGRSIGSDWSVAAVIDKSGDLPEVVAQWRGHTDHDLLGWKVAALSRFYNNCLLVIESNTLESAGESAYILEQLEECYDNLYYRKNSEACGGVRVGFHTNKTTKSLIIASLTGIVRAAGYIERDVAATVELDTYKRLPNGSYCAQEGCHDDILMTRAIGLYISAGYAPHNDDDTTAGPVEW